ncbi:MAG: DUF3068 domain-containing protein [Thermoplasmata archaeon]|nr:MAG: DUF3068 domain-containing protein [Thermoplasmata archaeon]
MNPPKSRPKGNGPRKVKPKRRPRRMVVIGVSLLVFAAAWSTLVVPSLFAMGGNGGPDGDGGTSFGAQGDGGSGLDEDTAILEGRIGFMGLIASLMDDDGSEEPFDFLNITRADLDLQWTPFQITGQGMVDPETGDPLFGDGDGSFAGGAAAGLEGGSDPIGPEPRDYRVWNAFINDSVVARYVAERTLEGRTVRVYEVDVRGAAVDMAALSASGLFGTDGFGGADQGSDAGPDEGSGSSSDVGDMGAASFLGEGSDISYDELSTYYVDAATGIPLDLEMDLLVSMVFPDASLMMVTEGKQVTTTYGELWVPHPVVPGAYDSIDVKIESHLLTEVQDIDETIAVFDSWVVYYDNATGEPLPDQYQPDHEIYAVDRTTSRYVAGFGNSDRKGYYGFPVGMAERRDYPMWDAMANSIVDARFVDETVVGGREAFIYEQVAEDVVVEGPNMVLPVYRHPGLEYVYDSTTTYTIDSRTGLLLDLVVDATVLLAPPGPVKPFTLPVTSFSFGFDDDFTEMMVGISNLYEEVLLPLSNEEVPVFGMELSFTPEMTDLLVEVASFVEVLDNTFNLWVPVAVVLTGVSLVAVGTLRMRALPRDR